MLPQRAPRRRGQSLVEFALLLPVLTLLLVGAIDLARVFYADITIANASRTAAGFAINWREADKYRTSTDLEWRAATGIPPAVPNPCAGIANSDECGRRRATTLTRWIAVREASNLGITISDVAMTFDGPAWEPNTQFVVTVDYDFTAITPIISRLWGGGALALEHSTRLRHSCTATSACTYS